MPGARQPRQGRENPFLTPTIMTLTFWQLRFYAPHTRGHLHASIDNNGTYCLAASS